MRWNDEQGFGFIHTDAVGEDVFIHISAFGGLSRRPAVGDMVIFNLETDSKRRKRAVNASIEGMESVFLAREIEKPPIKLQRKPAVHEQSNTRRKSYTNHGNSGSSGFIGLVFIIGILVVGYKAYSTYSSNASDATIGAGDFEPVVSAVRQPIAASYHCEGKTRCSQMTSCAEAVFYLNNCPGSVTDGDGDGRPCEDQWCGH
nr:cold shock domain-containing protein [Methylomonas sp. SURF-2]